MNKPTVLISDDDPYIVSMLERLARQAGLNAITETNAQRVLDLAEQHQPSVIILDVNQAIDGRDVLVRLKQHPATRGIRVVMLSGREDQYTRHTCFELGADDYEVKPFDVAFMSRIARLAGSEPRNTGPR